MQNTIAGYYQNAQKQFNYEFSFKASESSTNIFEENKSEFNFEKYFANNGDKELQKLDIQNAIEYLYNLLIKELMLNKIKNLMKSIYSKFIF